jgi:hypothetical protein
MIDLSHLDRMARAVVDYAVGEEKENFSGQILNDKVEVVCQMRKQLSVIMLDTSPEKTPRHLFEDTSIADVTEEFAKGWEGELTEMMVTPPLLATLGNAKTWRSKPGYDDLKRRFGGSNLSLHTLETEQRRNGEEVRIVVIAPKFPEWYIFTTSSHGMSDAERLAVLETVPEALEDLGQERLDPDEIALLYFHYMKDISTDLYEFAKSNDVVKKFMVTWMGFYKLCGLKFDSDTIHDLPPFYKEYTILFLASIYDQPIVQMLRESAKETAQQRA